MPPTTQINIRRDTAANFTSANPTLALGEIAYETDTRNIKVGDGATAWTALGYINPYRGGTAAAPTSNTVLGSGAGAAMQSGATLNTVVGNNAGAAITTGTRNTAVGMGALQATQTGIRQTAVGYAALANSSGTGNTAVGDFAGQGISSGAANTVLGYLTMSSGGGSANSVTAVGSNSLQFNTASDITAVGAFALDANTTGTNNTAVGKDALGACTTGSNNTLVGAAAGDAITTSQTNTAIGAAALSACTTGPGNTVIGSSAGLTGTTLSQNVLIGVDAGRVSNGTGNVAVGWAALTNDSASTGAVGIGIRTLLNTTVADGVVAVGNQAARYRGSGTDTLTNATNSVFIGNTSRAAANSETNQVVIAGINGLGNGSNTTTIGNSSTTDTYLAGDVTINGDDIFGGTVVGGQRSYNSLTFGGGAPSLNLMRSSTNQITVGVSNASPYNGIVGSTNNTGLVLQTNGVARMTFAGNANGVTIPAGNLIIGTAGNGIDFSATANSSGTMTSELLSDYEEGTFTPDIRFGGGSVSMTYTTQEANYTKVGRQVTIRGFIELSNKGTSTGAATLSNLPFTAIGFATGSVDIGNVTFADRVALTVSNATTNAAFNETTNAGARTGLTDADFTNTSLIIFTLTYFT